MGSWRECKYMSINREDIRYGEVPSMKVVNGECGTSVGVGGERKDQKMLPNRPRLRRGV